MNHGIRVCVCFSNKVFLNELTNTLLNDEGLRKQSKMIKFSEQNAVVYFYPLKRGKRC